MRHKTNFTSNFHLIEKLQMMQITFYGRENAFLRCIYFRENSPMQQCIPLKYSWLKKEDHITQGVLCFKNLIFPKAERDQRFPCLVDVIFCLFSLICQSNFLFAGVNQSEVQIEINKQTKTKNNQMWASLKNTFSFVEGQIFRAVVSNFPIPVLTQIQGGQHRL